MSNFLKEKAFAEMIQNGDIQLNPAFFSKTYKTKKWKAHSILSYHRTL